MLRSLLLYLSSAGWARRLVTGFFLTRRMSRRFVAGETLEEAIQAARQMNEKKLVVSMDHLGESVTDKQMALQATQDSIDLLEAIHQNKLEANVSVKLTQLGLDIDEELCTDNVRRIVTKASETGTSVNIDMESSRHTEITLRIFHLLRQDFDNVSIVIQSYLRRSKDDMRQLAEKGTSVRLCKGAYKEPAEIAFSKKSEVDNSFVELTELFMAPEYRERGAYLKIATHDPKMLQAAIDYIKANNIPKNQFEFQMLYGIRTQTQLDLVEQGYQVRVYIPYGTEWYPYFMRRLAERPANLWFLLKNLFSR